MMIAVSAMIALFLGIAGYIWCCFYLQNMKWEDRTHVSLKPVGWHRKMYLFFMFGSIGALLALFHFKYDSTFIHQLKILSLVLFILPIAAVDYRVQKIPNRILGAAVVFRIILYFFEALFYSDTFMEVVKEGITGAIILGGFFMLLAFVFKNSIGMGDIKLFGVMALYQGIWGAINSIFFSMMVAFIVAVALLITRKKGRKDGIAFGPCAWLGTLISVGLSGI